MALPAPFMTWKFPSFQFGRSHQSGNHTRRKRRRRQQRVLQLGGGRHSFRLQHHRLRPDDVQVHTASDYNRMTWLNICSVGFSRASRRLRNWASRPTCASCNSGLTTSTHCICRAWRKRRRSADLIYPTCSGCRLPPEAFFRPAC